MDIVATNAKPNLGVNRPVQTEGAQPQNQKLNAFGIGEANKPQVEVSAQAKILQQTEQRQLERRQDAPATEEKEQESRERTNDFVRVSSSLGESAQANNLNSEKAAELYRSIEKLL